MAWPLATDVQAHTGVTVTASGTPSTYKTSYGLDVDELLTRAKAFAAEVCHRDPAYGFDEVAVTSEKHDYDGGCLIYVGHPPIVAVTSVVIGGTTLSAANEDYYVYTNYVKLAQASEAGLEAQYPSIVLPQEIVVSYTGGYSDTTGTHIAIPAELKRAVLKIACVWLMQAHEQWRTWKGAESMSAGQVQAKFNYTAELDPVIKQLREGRWAIQGW